MRKRFIPSILGVLLVSFIGVSAQTNPQTILETQYTYEYLKFRDKASQAFLEKSKKVDDEFKLASYSRWDFAQESGQLVFSDNGIRKVVADVQIAGDWSANGTWLWAWSNDSINKSLKKEMSKVRKFGQEKQFFELVNPELTVPLENAWTLTAIAGYLINAKTAFRGQNGSG